MHKNILDAFQVTHLLEKSPSFMPFKDQLTVIIRCNEPVR